MNTGVRQNLLTGSTSNISRLVSKATRLIFFKRSSYFVVFLCLVLPILSSYGVVNSTRTMSSWCIYCKHKSGLKSNKNSFGRKVSLQSDKSQPITTPGIKLDGMQSLIKHRKDSIMSPRIPVLRQTTQSFRTCINACFLLHSGQSSVLAFDYQKRFV